MTNTTPTAPQGGESLRPEFAAVGSNKADDYAIAPEDQAIVDAIGKIDPINDVPRPHEIPEGWQVAPLRLTALPPHMQGAIAEKLRDVAPEKRMEVEDRLTAEAIRGMRADLIVKTGVGENALPYHREMVALAREYRDLEQEADRIVDSLREIARYEVRRDPQTGEVKPVAVLKLQGTRRDAAEQQLQDVQRRSRLLFNDDGTRAVEGQDRIRKAMSESVGLVKARNQQLADEAEARELGAKMVRDERIKAKAESYARLGRNGG